MNNTDDQVIKIDKTSDKYKVALKFVNKILTNIGNDEIDDLTKFVDIDREDIIKEVNRKTLDEMEKEIFALYNKKKCGYYRKTDAIVLNCLRGIMKEAGFEFNYEQKDKYETINDKKYRKTFLLYSIK
ncbi:hypothetical protein Indivirus_13_2 [Indivirus ILV1]|uniref:Uncharacterized protein n=1 Tax=Indivirus ILV1 TaxID=1977633 RepID=A0A1V0SEL3_9VIRU|nr:hypothetical protein Indivirus_13_2 [Indivirus ILV1]